MDMKLFYLLINYCLCSVQISAHRLIQYHSSKLNNTVVGSTKAAINHQIGVFPGNSESQKAVFIPIKQANIESVKPYITAGSPIIFMVDSNEYVNTTELEDFLISTGHKVPIYFTYDTDIHPTEFHYVRTSEMKSNAAIKKVTLQNAIGTKNSSLTRDKERIAIITAPFDSFATVPSAKIGANTNGLSLSVFLEIMRLVSKYPMANNWAFVFALTDGHFCGFDGLEKFLSSFMKSHSGKVEFAISLESIASPNLRGLFGQRIKRGSAFAKFLMCLIEAMKQADIPLETGLSEEHRTQTVFSKHLIQSIAIVNGDDRELSRLGDSQPNLERADQIAWVITEALLRMMYNSDMSAVMVEKQKVNAGYWANMIAKIPRMPHFRDSSIVYALGQWMKKFSTVHYEEWSSNKCQSTFAGAEATLVLYNQTPFMKYLFCFVFAIIYGAAVFFVAQYVVRKA